MGAIESVPDRFVVLIDTLTTRLADRADVLIPGATWAEKSGSFESVTGRLQAFERAIRPIDFCKSESQIALDLVAVADGEPPTVYNPAATRRKMAELHGLGEFLTDVHLPAVEPLVESDMAVVEI